MAEPLKNMYSRAFLEHLGEASLAAISSFDVKRFVREVMDKDWADRELKQRMRHITEMLQKQLAQDYPKSLDQLKDIIAALRQRKARENSFEYMFFPDYIEVFGQQHLAPSLKAIEHITQFTSCEFAVRPFLLRHPKEVMQQMTQWSKHTSHLVRRFSSEGCRPRLPWAMAIPSLKADPAPILPILENLKNDSSEFVRKSVANNLNDIAKDHPDKVIELAKSWKGQSKETDWILKHGCRTLLRKAEPQVLKLFDLNTKVNIDLESLHLEKRKIGKGAKLEFEFSFISQDKKPVRLRVEYAIYFMKANGKANRKLFKITENTYEPGQRYTFARAHAFKDLTTRKHYPGKHSIAIVLNGKEYPLEDFILMN